MLVEWQLRPLVQVHSRRDGDVGDGRPVAAEPFAIAQSLVEDAGQLVEIRRLAIQHCLVRRAAEQRLGTVLHQVDVAARKPRCRFPKQPAVYVGALGRVGRIVLCLAMLIGGVLQDRIRFPQYHVTIFHRRQCLVWIYLLELLALMLTFEIIDFDRV